MKVNSLVNIIIYIIIGLSPVLAATSSPKWVSIGIRDITSYNCTVIECDNEPDIGAFGRVAYKGNPTGFWFAGNRFNKGDKIRIPALTGEIIWICRDRTAKKVSHRIDLLFPLDITVGGVRKAEVFLLK